MKHLKSLIVAMLFCFALGACSTPLTKVSAVSRPNHSAAFDVSMTGCWGIDTGCFGVVSLSVREYGSTRILWEVHLPGMRAGRVEYGSIPKIEDVRVFGRRHYNRWPEDDNPGLKVAPALPKNKVLVATVSSRYDSPWPSAGGKSCFFMIASDGSIRTFESSRQFKIR